MAEFKFLNTGEIQPKTTPESRTLLADDHFLIAEAISILLAPHFNVVGMITDAILIAGEVSRLRPDLALLDVTMPGLSGVDAGRIIRERTAEH